MKQVVITLAIIGAVFGLIGAVFALGIGSLGSAFGAGGANSALKGGLIDILASIVGLVGGILIFSKPKVGGWMLIGSAIAGFVATFIAFLIPFVLFLVSGIISLRLPQEYREKIFGV